MKKPSPEETGERVLSREELRALQEALDQLPSQSSDVVRLLLLTGVRLRMVLGMRRDELQDVDEEVAPGRAPARARWIVAGGYGGRSKNRRSHVTPLSTAALAIVRRRLELTPAHCEFLFPNRASRKRAAVWLSSYVRRLERRLQRCLNAARAEREPPEPAAVVPDWTVHELRHTVRTHLREQLHVRGDVAELIVGHVRRGVQGIYDRSELLPERRAALEAWAAWLAAVKAERPAKVLGFPLAPPDTENAGGL
jgi:integrase